MLVTCGELVGSGSALMWRRLRHRSSVRLLGQHSRMERRGHERQMSDKDDEQHHHPDGRGGPDTVGLPYAEHDSVARLHDADQSSLPEYMVIIARIRASAHLILVACWSSHPPDGNAPHPFFCSHPADTFIRRV